VILALDLDDAGLAEAPFFFNDQCRAIGRFLENQFARRFEPVELQLPRKPVLIALNQPRLTLPER